MKEGLHFWFDKLVYLKQTCLNQLIQLQILLRLVMFYEVGNYKGNKNKLWIRTSFD